MGSRTKTRKSLKKSEPLKETGRKIPLRFKSLEFERKMVEKRWVVNGHVMMDYFPVYMPAETAVGAGAEA